MSSTRFLASTQEVRKETIRIMRSKLRRVAIIGHVHVELGVAVLMKVGGSSHGLIAHPGCHQCVIVSAQGGGHDLDIG